MKIDLFDKEIDVSELWKTKDMTVSTNSVDTKIVIGCKSGKFSVGVNNDGQAYIATQNGRIAIVPDGSNRLLISETRD